MELAGDAVTNIICSEAGMSLSKMPKGAEFSKKFEARFKVPIQIYSPFSYDAVYVIADAMKRANSTKAEAILAAMPSTNYDGLIGHIAFDSKGDMKEGVITLYQFANKKKEILDVMKM